MLDRSKIFPKGKSFIFTIVDDTDNDIMKNTKPVYDLLYKNGIITTKTIWPLGVKSSNHFNGLGIHDDKYLNYIKDLKHKGFEIALHNVGSGFYTRNEIIEGLELFNSKLGSYPKIHINHSSNSDNIYWGYKRFMFPINILYKIINRKRYLGEEKHSPCYWGDYCKKHIKYIRNHTFNDINTFKCDKYMPYLEKRKLQYSNFWFSSSDAPSCLEFNKLVSKDNIDRLESENGICIIYTHFGAGFVDENGILNSEFKEIIEYLGSKNGWFVPASTVLDYLLEQKYYNNYTLSRIKKLKLDFKWLRSKLQLRK